MKVTTFQSIADRYASAMGRNDKVRLTFGGDMAFTDGRNINLPALPSGTVMTPHEAMVFNGYLDHETAHIRFTDFSVFKQEGKGFLEDPVSHHIWNVVEDIRIENAQMGPYPGSRQYLDALAEEVDTNGIQRDSQVPDTKSRRILKLLYKELYVTYRQVPHQIPIPGQLANEGQLGFEIDQILKRRMHGMKSERDSLVIAKEIRTLLDDEIKKDRQSAQKIMGAAMAGLFGKGSDKPGQEKGQGMTQDELKQAAALESELRERVQAFGKLLSDIKKGNKAEDDKSEKDHDARYKKMNWKGQQVLAPATTEHDKIFVPAQKDHKAYAQAKANLSGEILSVKKMARIYMQSRSRAAWSKGLEEGSLDTDVLSDLFVGDRNVYKELRHRRVVNTAVQLLLDLSGSMSTTMVRNTAILLSEALDPIKNLKLSIAGFTTNNGRATPRDGNHRPVQDHWRRNMSFPKGTGRLEGLDILEFKDFDEPYKISQDRLGAIRTSAATPLGDGYGHGFAHIVNRAEPRRILWIVSDGEPAISVGDETHNELLLMKRIHNMCRRHKVEVWGLGIGSHLQLKDYVDVYAEIQDCSQLPEMVLNSVREVVRQ